MRCLYCGNELALLRKLTGYGEFCSEAHRQKYQEQYNRLALTRLLQAQDGEPERRPLTTPLRASRPASAIAPGKARREIESGVPPPSQPPRERSGSVRAAATGAGSAPGLAGFLPHLFEPAVSKPRLDPVGASPAIAAAAMVPDSCRTGSGNVHPDAVPSPGVVVAPGWGMLGDARFVDLPLARVASGPVQCESAIVFEFPAEYSATIGDLLKLAEGADQPVDAATARMVREEVSPAYRPPAKTAQNGSGTKPAAAHKPEADSPPPAPRLASRPGKPPKPEPARPAGREKVEVTINWAALGMLDPDLAEASEAPEEPEVIVPQATPAEPARDTVESPVPPVVDEAPPSLDQPARPVLGVPPPVTEPAAAPLEITRPVAEPVPPAEPSLIVFAGLRAKPSPAKASEPPSVEVGVETTPSDSPRPPTIDESAPAVESTPVWDPACYVEPPNPAAPVAAESPLSQVDFVPAEPPAPEFIWAQTPEPLSGASRQPAEATPVAPALAAVPPEAKSEIPVTARQVAAPVPILCTEPAVVPVGLADGAFTPIDEAAFGAPEFPIQTPALTTSPLRPKLVLGPSPAHTPVPSDESAESLPLNETLQSVETSVPHVAPAMLVGLPPAPQASPEPTAAAGGPPPSAADSGKVPPTAPPPPGKYRRKTADSADLEALRAEMERQVRPAAGPGAKVRRIAVLVALILLVALAGYLIYEAVVPKAGATASTAHAEAFGPSLISGEGGWSVDWAGQTPGAVSGRQVYIFRPSLTMADYRFEFQGQIESKGLGWVFRAANPRNYYAMKVEMIDAGPEPKVALWRTAIINGEETQKTRIDLRVPARPDTVYKVREDVLGSTFRTYVQDELVDTWNDDRLPVGGVGLWKDKDEAAQVRMIQLHALRSAN